MGSTNAADPAWEILADVARRSQRYLSTVDERSVTPSAEALSALGALDVPLQNEPMTPGAVIEELDRFAAPATIAMAGPRFFGFVNGGATPAALAANWLTTAWEQHGAFEVSSPGSTRLERIALRWILDLLGLPPSADGAFVTGTTVAHMVALATARDTLLEQLGWNARTEGLIGAPRIDVIVGEEAHSTIFKALGFIGLGRSRVIRVPVDDQGRMRADAMPSLMRPSIVCTQAGNVNTGASDPFSEIIGHARASGVPTWVHVDGAFGIWAKAAPSRAHLVAGAELADSWATDAHKWLNVPYDCGMVLMRDGDAGRRTMAVTADYLPTDQRNPSDLTPEMSRRPRGVDTWATLRALGRSGLADLVERNCRFAKRFADAFAAAGYAVLNDVVLNQVLVSFGDADRTRSVIAGVQADGTCWCGPTIWQGKTAMRVSVISWATQERDIDESIAAILRIAKE